MTPAVPEFDELLTEFVEETTAALAECDGHVTRLHANPRDIVALEVTRRIGHSIRQTANFLGFTALEALAASLVETVAASGSSVDSAKLRKITDLVIQIRVGIGDLDPSAIAATAMTAQGPGNSPSDTPDPPAATSAAAVEAADRFAVAPEIAATQLGATAASNVVLTASDEVADAIGTADENGMVHISATLLQKLLLSVNQVALQQAEILRLLERRPGSGEAKRSALSPEPVDSGAAASHVAGAKDESAKAAAALLPVATAGRSGRKQRRQSPTRPLLGIKARAGADSWQRPAADETAIGAADAATPDRTAATGQATERPADGASPPAQAPEPPADRKLDRSANSAQGPQARNLSRMLLFESGGVLRAIPVDRISRLEEVDLSTLDARRGLCVMRSGTDLIPLFPMDSGPLDSGPMDSSPVDSVRPPPPNKRAPAIIVSLSGQSFGLLVDTLLEVLEAELVARSAADDKHRIGHLRAGGRSIEVIDPVSMIQAFLAEWTDPAHDGGAGSGLNASLTPPGEDSLFVNKSTR